MDFSVPAYVQEITRRVRQFVDREVIPLEAESDAHIDGILPEALADLRAKARAEGIFAPQLPKELGGLGMTLEEIVPVFEAAGRSLLGPLALTMESRPALPGRGGTSTTARPSRSAMTRSLPASPCTCTSNGSPEGGRTQ